MTRHAHLDPSSFLLTGGPTGVLLIHGYTGSPTEMRLLGDDLHARGLTVLAPQLPGHGTTPADMNRYRWTDWAAHAEQSLADLRQRCERVFVGGLSLGSMLSLYLALQHADLPGVIAYSPPLWVKNRLVYLTPVARYFKPFNSKAATSDLFDPAADRQLWSYEVDPVPAAHEVLKLMHFLRPRLPQVTCPLLLIYSTCDTAIHPESARRTYARIGSADKTLVKLEQSGHCITVDQEWRQVAAQTYDFIIAHGGSRDRAAVQ